MKKESKKKTSKKKGHRRQSDQKISGIWPQTISTFEGGILGRGLKKDWRSPGDEGKVFREP